MPLQYLLNLDISKGKFFITELVKFSELNLSSTTFELSYVVKLEI